MSHAVEIDAIEAARTRIAPFVHVTPVVTSRTLDALAEKRLFLKCENLQRGGAFKIRGATNAVLSLPDPERARGVVTHSSGNHGQALAIAARSAGVRAFVVVPRGAPAVKRAAVAGYGAETVDCEPTLAARVATAEQVVQRTGAILIPPFDHPDVIAGQGTVALELLEQVPDLDTIVAPVGGGGLVSGIAIAAAARAPQVRVVAAEPSGADDAARSKAAGERLPQPSPQTIADGLRTSLGDLTWPIVRDLVSEVVTVDDREIIDAMRLVFERVKLVVEPSGVVSLAAALSRRVKGERIGVVLSGGNVDLGALPF